MRLAASRRGPGSLRPHAAKESGYASQLPPLKSARPYALSRGEITGRLAPMQRSAAGEASDGIPVDAGASLDPTWGSSVAGQCRRHAGPAYASNAIG